jgi:uracil phosphoribosyltransferase
MSRYRLSEIEHAYGNRVHILDHPFLTSHLARLCAETTVQPEINQLVETIYQSMLQIVVDHEFPRIEAKIPTRMVKTHPKEAILSTEIVDRETPVVSVNLARAGTLPSQVCYNALNSFINPAQVRQDHISIARATDQKDRVTGSVVSGHKIGGDVRDRIVLFPDPMGATGSTLVQALDLYKQNGRAAKLIGLHCIVTPEYLKRVLAHHQGFIVYAIRVDRGLSPPAVLKEKPGVRWDEEKGLSDKDYIIPGGGGFGEIMNNSWV